MSVPSAVEEIFLAALAKSAPEERAAFLEQVCQGDEDLRQRVERLLAAAPRAGGVGEPPVAPQPERTGAYTPEPGDAPHTGPHVPATVDYSAEVKPGVVIAGRYTLIEKIGEGGMGEVWVARQTEPVKRRVALKLIKPGMDSRGVLVRFEQERQALAVMDHPSIAKVFDGGASDGEPGGVSPGRPYFVMELVNGLPLTKFCDDARLMPRQRLELFVSICHAVQHAHQKGIIHRDLKPANILVTLQDGKPVPKVIDFGVAKAIGGKLIDESLSTQFGAVVGTLEYMSPEQAGLSGFDIDTRSDIYSLGVILYELLTGLRPIDAKRLRKAALTEMIRIIQQEEPSKPSTRLSTDDSLPSLAALRQTEPRRLMAMLRGELDWVVMKCLEKDRHRRYETANGLARDIQNYLADEPVEARPPTFGYRAGKFLRRHKGPVLAASMVLLVLVGGVIGTSWGMVRAETARDNEAERAEGERLAKESAQKRLQQVEKGIEILGSLFKDIDPIAVQRQDVPLLALLGERLDQATQELQGDAIGDPLAVAKLQMTLGSTQYALGHPEKGAVLLRAARPTLTAELGPEDRLTLDCIHDLAACYALEGKHQLAIPLFEETLRISREKFGPRRHATLVTMNNLATVYRDAGLFDRAVPLFEEAFELHKAELGPTNRSTLACMTNLADVYRLTGKDEQALPIFEEVLDLGKETFGANHPYTLRSMNNLALAYFTAGRLAVALPLFEEAFKLQTTRLGAEHPDTLTTMMNLADAYLAGGTHERAVKLLEEALQLQKAKGLAADHPQTLQLMSNLGTAYWTIRQPARALPLFEEAFKLAGAKFGPDHPTVLRLQSDLALNYGAAGQTKRALPLLERTLRQQQDKLGPDHPDTLRTMNNLGMDYVRNRQVDEGVALLEECLERYKKRLGKDHPDTLGSMTNLADGYRAAGKIAAALLLLDEAVKLEKVQLGPDHPATLSAMNNLAIGYHLTGQTARALPIMEETVKLRKARYGTQQGDTLNSMNSLALIYYYLDKLDLSEQVYREVEQAQTAQVGPDHASTLGTKQNLARLFEHQGKHAQAEPYWRALLEAQRRNDVPSTLATVNALARLAECLLLQSRYAEAEPSCRELLSLSQKLQPDAADTFYFTCLLGGSLLGQKNYAGAEPLLLAGYEGMKQREAEIPEPGRKRLTRALERLVQLYDAWEKKDESARWQKELEARKKGEKKEPG